MNPHERRLKLQQAVVLLRPHQWAKNLLLFVPIITAHALHLVGFALLAFVSFCCVSSAVYIINDVADLAADRAHPRKWKRPLASGMISVRLGLTMSALLLAVGFCMAGSLPRAYVGVLLLYLAVTFAYSFKLKTVPILDVIILAGLYTLRIFAGGTATGIGISEWLLVFSLFIFLSLAFIKRFAELRQSPATAASHETIAGRGYLPSDADIVRSFGITSGFMSVLVFALYINSEKIQTLYHHPQWLWAICPILIYWLSRAWLLTERGLMHDDPVAFAVKDAVSYGCGLFILGIIFKAT